MWKIIDNIIKKNIAMTNYLIGSYNIFSEKHKNQIKNQNLKNVVLTPLNIEWVGIKVPICDTRLILGPKIVKCASSFIKMHSSVTELKV